MVDEILTVAQAASYLKVCDKTVRRLITNNKITASKIGGCWRIQKKDIDIYLRETQNQRQEALRNE